jgi:hypothetical protein
MLAPLEQLTSLEMCIVVYSERVAPDDTRQQYIDVATSLIRGGLARFLKGLPRLRHLEIGLDMFRATPLAFGIDSVHVLDSEAYWPDLQSLSLKCIALNSQHMLPFFDKHSRTINHVALENVMVLGDQLTDFFHDMRKMINMTFFEANGKLLGLLRQRGDAVIGRPWAVMSYDMFDFNVNDPSRLGRRLEAFCLGDGVYPLGLDQGHRLSSLQNIAQLGWMHQNFIPN